MAKTEEQIKNEMKANSEAWHSADPTTRKNLEAANQELGKQIGGVYDAASGKWSDSNGNPLYENINENTGVDISGVDTTYKAMQDNLNASTSAMMKLQQDRTDFEVKQIEQQKEQAKKDLEKEKTSAYTEYQKQINPYGVNAEQLASQGMSGTGYAESSRVRMYTAYQQRVAVAKESYDKAVVSYNNAMTEARLQNSTVLAQLAFDTLQKSLELTINGLQYKNELLMRLDEINYNRKRDALADERYEEEKKYGREQDALANERYEEEKKYSREQDALANEIQYATLTGDYSKLEAKGWVIDYDRLNYELNSSNRKDALNESVIAAEYGNFEPLEKLGIKVSDEYKEAFKKGLLNNGTEINFTDDSPETKEEVVSDYSNLIRYHYPNSNKNGKSPTQHTLISTPFYKGAVNKDALNGTFNTVDSNGVMYQPNNINGKPLNWTGDYIEFETTELYGENIGKRVHVKQKIWETPSGNKWYWDGAVNKYVPLEEERGLLGDFFNSFISDYEIDDYNTSK